MWIVVAVVAVMFISSLVWLFRHWNAEGPTDLWKDDDIVRRESPVATEPRAPGRPDPHLAQPLIEVGYWATELDPDRPDPRSFVDPAWSPEERELIRRHLAKGSPLPWDHGPVETCAFCSAVLVTEELTDGTYVWPTGLLHYVDEHAVRLPGLFVLDVRRAPPRDPSLVLETFVELDSRETAWWDSLSGP